jgi:RNA polymerase sigma-70 factor (ECF subfamily)
MSSPSYTSAQAAFLKAYDEYADSIFRFALMKVSNRELALDITQEVFTKSWEYVTRGNTIDNWKAFLFRSAHNMIIDHYRKKKSDSLDQMEEDAGFLPVAEELAADMGAEAKRIQHLITTLPKEYQTPLVLRFVDGLQPKDIAEILGLSVNVVSVRIHRGVEKLRDIVRTA